MYCLSRCIMLLPRLLMQFPFSAPAINTLLCPSAVLYLKLCNSSWVPFKLHWVYSFAAGCWEHWAAEVILQMLVKYIYAYKCNVKWFSSVPNTVKCFSLFVFLVWITLADWNIKKFLSTATYNWALEFWSKTYFSLELFLCGCLNQL